MYRLMQPSDEAAVVALWQKERGDSAESAAEQACTLARTFLPADVPVGEPLAAQLLLPLAMAGGGAFRTLPPSSHTRTNAEVIARFLPVRFTFQPEGETRCRIDVVGR